MPDIRSSGNNEHRDCENCRYFLKCHGWNIDHTEILDRGYWCSKKNCKIRDFPGKCALKKEKK